MKPVRGRQDETQPRFAVSNKYITGNEGFIDATGDVTSRQSIITATSKNGFPIRDLVHLLGSLRLHIQFQKPWPLSE